MQIGFKKEQIVKDKPQSILIDYGEYKLSLPKWMVKNNSFTIIKGVLCQIVMDDCMTFTDNDNKTKIMSYVLATPGAMKRYMLQNTVVYVQDINDGKVGRRYLVGGEVTGEAIPYITDDEITSRWMLCGVINKTDLSSKVTTLTTNIIADTNKKNQLLDTTIKNTTELTSLNPNLINPTIKYFSDAQGKTNVSNQNQKAGDLYIVITADINDGLIKVQQIQLK